MSYSTSDLLGGIRALANGAGPMTIMEVCGTHTANIRKYGIPTLLPENIRLVSGPGCPVCVTAQEDIAAALSIADRDNVIFASFGDMMRVPCGKESLYSLYERGRDVRLVTSPTDALKIAAENPAREVVYFGIGFETTAPLTAALIEAAKRSNLKNLSVLSAHKTMPQAILSLLEGKTEIDALLCPGHVATIIGSDAFSFVPEKLGLPSAVSGFEVYDILAAILRILDMLKRGETANINMYPKAVASGGNPLALELMYRVLEPTDAVWRGLGTIPRSGLKIRESYAGFDALSRFEIAKSAVREPAGCLCPKILRGEKIPPDCAHFGKSCTPDAPLGPCMVSSEGSCAAYFKYREA